MVNNGFDTIVVDGGLMRTVIDNGFIHMMSREDVFNLMLTAFNAVRLAHRQYNDALKNYDYYSPVEHWTFKELYLWHSSVDRELQQARPSVALSVRFYVRSVSTEMQRHS